MKGYSVTIFVLIISFVAVAAAVSLVPIGGEPLLNQLAGYFIPSPDFVIALDPPSWDVPVGGTGFSTFTLNSLKNGNSVDLSAPGNPQNFAIGFTRNSLSTKKTSIMYINTSYDTPLGSYPITVSAKSGKTVRNYTFELNVIDTQDNLTVFDGPFASGQLLVKLRQGKAINSISNANSKNKVLSVQKLIPGVAASKDLDRWYILNFDPAMNLGRLRQIYSIDPSVEYSQLNYLYNISLTPNDANFSILWGMQYTVQMINGVPG